MSTIRPGNQILGGLLALTLSVGWACAQDEGAGGKDSIFQQGPGAGELDKWASIEIPEGFVFSDGPGTRLVMQQMGNPPSNQEVGMLAPTNLDWFIVFEFDDIGYVKDDEKDSLDATAMLKSIREGNDAGNKVRSERGYSTLSIVGWEIKPRYNDDTQNLEWSIRARDDKDGGEILNHNTRVLGRQGVMKVTLVAGPEQISAVMPTFSERLDAMEFKDGQKYAEYKKGDKIAKYGLSALVVGGAAAVAMKSGLFKYIWKGLVIGVIAIGAFAKRMFGKS